MIPEPQDEIFCVVNGDGELHTYASSGRWAFKTLYHATRRAVQDRDYGRRQARVARYKFDGWAD